MVNVFYFISSDGDEVHRVIYSLQNAQKGRKSRLQLH